MSSLTDRFRSSAGKAAFEADKLRRLTAAQGAIKPLRGDADRLYYELGKLAYLIHGRGGIHQSELLTACHRLDEIQAQITAAEAEVEAIRNEEYVEPLPSNMAQGDLICPNGHGSLVAGAAFCQKCGTAGVRPTARSATPCGNCGAAIEPKAQFCASCGASVKRCHNCGTVLVPGAVFCAECGTAVAAEENRPQPSTPDERPASREVEWVPFSSEEEISEEEPAISSKDDDATESS